MIRNPSASLEGSSGGAARSREYYLRRVWLKKEAQTPGAEGPAAGRAHTEAHSGCSGSLGRPLRGACSIRPCLCCM